MEDYDKEPILAVPTNLENISSPANDQQIQGNDMPANSSIISQLEKGLAQDAMKLQNLIQTGILNQKQGQYYTSQLAKKSYEIERLKQDIAKSSPRADIFNAIEEFNMERPEFFNTEGRSEVLDYLKNSNVNVDKDEITQISKMVENIENNAIQRYLRKQAHEKVLLNENEAAKRKLTANAQNSSSTGNNARAFTREQIGRMSGAEFTKNEPIIMEQLRKGLIR